MGGGKHVALLFTLSFSQMVPQRHCSNPKLTSGLIKTGSHGFKSEKKDV